MPRGRGVSRSSRQNQISVRCSRTKAKKFQKVCLRANSFVSRFSDVYWQWIHCRIGMESSHCFTRRRNEVTSAMNVNTVGFELAAWDLANLIHSKSQLQRNRIFSTRFDVWTGNPRGISVRCSRSSLPLYVERHRWTRGQYFRHVRFRFSKYLNISQDLRDLM